MKFKITIPKPCHEDFNKMTPTEKGKFCKSCSKEVVDFTNFTNSKLSNEILKGNNVCGRFRKNQLNQEINIQQKYRFPKIAASVVVVSTLFSTIPSYSQDKTERIEKIDKKQTFNVTKDTIVKDIIFKGKVKDRSGGLPGVSIYLKGTKNTRESDFDGNFSIKIPNKKAKSIILVFSYLGYKQQEVDILKVKKPLIVLLEEDETLLGEVVVVGYVSIKKKPNLFKRIFSIFKKKENVKN